MFLEVRDEKAVLRKEPGSEEPAKEKSSFNNRRAECLKTTLNY